jgi:hypothetical protein
MQKGRDLFKEITGYNWTRWTKINTIPSIDDTIDGMYKQARSNSGLRVLGHSEDGVLRVAEERRTHTHIIAGTREGKSKFLEKNIQLDIDRLIRNDPGACGLTLLDPTDSGETAYNVLKYCIRRGFERVCLIDPYHYSQFGKVACINPFKGKESNKWADISSINNTLQVTSEIRDQAQTKRIQRYLRALLSVLWDAGCTLSDLEYFTDLHNPLYAMKRKEILGKVYEFDRHRILLESVYKNVMTYRDFESTVRRVEDLLDEPIRSMFSHQKGVDFVQMIREKWVVLVNLDADGPLEPIHTRLLGTAVVNEIISALHRMRHTRNWGKPYYLYIDEAADYANRKLARVLSHKGKTGLRVYLAHQYAGQFEDKFVLDSVMVNCPTKVMMNLSGRVDRDLMTRMMYGGDIPDRDASFANSNLPKQTMIYKAPKGAPKRYRVADCFTPDISYSKEKEFIEKLLDKDWYYPVEKKEEDKSVYYQTKVSYESRPPGTSHTSPKKTSQTASGSNSKVTAPRRAPDSASESEDSFRRLHKDEVTHPEDDKE